VKEDLEIHIRFWCFKLYADNTSKLYRTTWLCSLYWWVYTYSHIGKLDIHSTHRSNNWTSTFIAIQYCIGCDQYWIVCKWSCLLWYELDKKIFRISELGKCSVTNNCKFLGQFRCNRLYHTKTRLVAIGPVPPPIAWDFNLTIWPPSECQSDCIVMWSIHRLCMVRWFWSSRYQICIQTNIGWVTIKNQWISHNDYIYFTAIK
jgi:hypothetical protein